MLELGFHSDVLRRHNAITRRLHARRFSFLFFPFSDRDFVSVILYIMCPDNDFAFFFPSLLFNVLMISGRIQKPTLYHSS